MRVQQRLNSVWSWLGEDRRAVEILALLLLLNVLCLIIPQSPIPAQDSVAQVRWLAQTAVEWQGPLRGLASLRLTHIRSSLWMRLSLAWLTFLLAAHVDRLRTAWTDSPLRVKLKSLLLSTGSLLIVTGWILYLVLGWTVPDLTTWPDEPLTIEEHNIEVPACSNWICLWHGKANLYLLPSGQTAGIEAQARDAEGQAVDLIPATKTESQQQLFITLAAPGAETFFLVREGERVVRLNESITDDGRLAVTLQAYDAQSRELLAEQTLAVNTNATILADPVEIKVAVQSLSQYDAVYNPGALVEILGFLLLISSVMLRGKINPIPAQEHESASLADE